MTEKEATTEVNGSKAIVIGRNVVASADSSQVSSAHFAGAESA